MGEKLAGITGKSAERGAMAKDEERGIALGSGNGSALSKVAVVGFCFAISPTPEQSNLS